MQSIAVDFHARHAGARVRAAAGAGVGAMSDDISVAGGALAGLGIAAGVRWGRAGLQMSKLAKTSAANPAFGLNQLSQLRGAGPGRARSYFAAGVRQGFERDVVHRIPKGLRTWTARGWSGVKTAIRHPYATMGAVGAVGAGAYYLSDSSPYQSPTDTNAAVMRMDINSEMAAIEAMESGIAPMGSMVSGAVLRNQRLMESTMGLTQGLHRSRH